MAYTISANKDTPHSRTFTVKTPPSRPSFALFLVCLVLAFSYLYSKYDPDRAGFVFLALLVFAVSRLNTFEESLTVLPSLGLQLSRTRRSQVVWFLLPFSSSTSTTFIPRQSIRDIVVDEGIQGLTIKPYLAILEDNGGRKGDGKVVVHVAFSNTLPNLGDLAPILMETRSTLLLDSQ